MFGFEVEFYPSKLNFRAYIHDIDELPKKPEVRVGKGFSIRGVQPDILCITLTANNKIEAKVEAQKILEQLKDTDPEKYNIVFKEDMN